MMMAKNLSLRARQARLIMGIVYPSKAVARRWDGALQARLRRAPLENFLKARGIAPAPRGVSQNCDDLVRATVCIVETGLALYFADRADGLASGQRAIVGHVACLVSRALAEQIEQPDAWRIAALVSTARLLSPWVGVNAAAMASACAVRQFQKEAVKGISPLDWRIMNSAIDVINGNGAGVMPKASTNIAALLSAGTSTEAEGLEGRRKSNKGF